jgi:hypothetical protein
MKVFILVEEYNAYDQYGSYFVEAFRNYPTFEQLAKYDCTHLGRQNDENHWYEIEEVLLK